MSLLAGMLREEQEAERHPRQVYFGIRNEDPCGNADAELDDNDKQDHYANDFLNFHAKRAGFCCANAKIEKKNRKTSEIY